MSFLDRLPTLISDANKNAALGCGQSDVLYESRLQDSYAAILASAPEHERGATEVVLKVSGYDPEFAPYQARHGECSLTGIEEDCCPCGRHL